MKTLKVLFKTEFLLAFREFSGVLFGILLPVGLMVLLGILYGDRPAFEGAGYTLVQQSFAAVVTIGICATGLMGLPLTVANYREKKILKRFMVTPTSPGSLLAVQFLNNMTFAVISSLLVWAAAKIFFGYTMPGPPVLFILMYALLTASIYSIGMLIASISGNIKTANLLTSLVYFPMFFLSGATIPYEIMPRGLQIFADLMPLTHGIKLLKGVSLNLSGEQYVLPVVILCITALAGSIISVRKFRWE